MREGLEDRATVKPYLTVRRGAEAIGATKRIEGAKKAEAGKGAGNGN